jgi:hypothetical protein
MKDKAEIKIDTRKEIIKPWIYIQTKKISIQTFRNTRILIWDSVSCLQQKKSMYSLPLFRTHSRCEITADKDQPKKISFSIQISIMHFFPHPTQNLSPNSQLLPSFVTVKLRNLKLLGSSTPLLKQISTLGESNLTTDTIFHSASEIDVNGKSLYCGSWRLVI